MCRLFGFRSNTPARVHQALVTEQNSLRKQSREHPDGWGIAYYEQGSSPVIMRGLGPAHQDPEFERVSELVSAPTVVAHVRLASVGSVKMSNAHPFTYEGWVFAHNGTLKNFNSHVEQFDRRIRADLRGHIGGDTDSERCFYLFLTHLLERHPLAEATAEDVARALVQTVNEAAAITDLPDAPSSMNFMVSNGRMLVVTRRNRTLLQLATYPSGEKARGHVPTGTQLSELVVSSEDLGGEDAAWATIPEASVVSVDREMVFRSWKFEELSGA